MHKNSLSEKLKDIQGRIRSAGIKSLSVVLVFIIIEVFYKNMYIANGFFIHTF